MKRWSILLVALSLLSLIPTDLRGEDSDRTTINLDAGHVRNIVRRSYQYVALYNIFTKGAAISDARARAGWNSLHFSGRLTDHTARLVPRPNNDTLYLTARMDLRKDPVILEFPAIDSKYVSLMTAAFDHYIEIPLSTTFGTGDFTKPSRVLFFTAHTDGYKGEPVEGVDRICEMTGDFVQATLRAMPHLKEPERAERIKSQLSSVKLVTLSQFRGNPAKNIHDIVFPAPGRTNADTFGTNLMEVMQFVMNYVVFDDRCDMDQALLAAYKPLGIEPGKPWDPTKTPKIDNALFRETAQRMERSIRAPQPGKSFMPKNAIDLDTMLFQTVVGPLGQPAHQALYLTPVAHGPLNAMNDYVIRMTREQLPPAKAFWSFTVYDAKNGFFIPNERHKYSVGENSGFVLGAQGGIEIYVTAEKPQGVPEENWIPVIRRDENIEVSIRIYEPDMEKLKSWTRPTVEVVKPQSPSVLASSSPSPPIP